MVTKELFINLALEQVIIGNRLGKGFNQKGWQDIIAGFKSKIGLTYDHSQFKNLYDKLRVTWQTWGSLIQNTGLGYDHDAKTFTMDNKRWDDMIKVRT